MAMKEVTTPGFYNGKFMKAGQHYDDTNPEAVVEGEASSDLDKMTKDELLAEAEKQGVEVKSSDTKAEILAALKAQK